MGKSASFASTCYCTISFILAVCFSVPEFPIAVRVNVPVGVLMVVLIVSVAILGLIPSSVTEEGEMLHVEFFGAPEHFSMMV
jgi:Na+/citrate or Na+/malate symporter